MVLVSPVAIAIAAATAAQAIGSQLQRGKQRKFSQQQLDLLTRQLGTAERLLGELAPLRGAAQARGIDLLGQVDPFTSFFQRQAEGFIKPGEISSLAGLSEVAERRRTATRGGRSTPGVPDTSGGLPPGPGRRGPKSPEDEFLESLPERRQVEELQGVDFEPVDGGIRVTPRDESEEEKRRRRKQRRSLFGEQV